MQHILRGDMSHTPQHIVRYPTSTPWDMWDAYVYTQREYARIAAEIAEEDLELAHSRTPSGLDNAVRHRAICELFGHDRYKVEIIHTRLTAVYRTLGPADWFDRSIIEAASHTPLQPDGRFIPSQLFDRARWLRELEERDE